MFTHLKVKRICNAFYISGKTMSVNAVANRFNKRVLMVDFPSLYGKKGGNGSDVIDLKGLFREAEMSDTASVVVALRSSAHTSLFSQPRAYLLSRHPPHRRYPSRPPSHVPDSSRDDSERPIAAATVSDITGVHRG